MKKISKILGLFILFLGMSCLISTASAFIVSSVSIDPGVSPITPGAPVTVSYMVDFSELFPSDNDLQFYTDLDDSHWTYTIIVNGVENLRPTTGGHTLNITAFELVYAHSATVAVRVTLEGDAPIVVTSETNKIIVFPDNPYG